MDIDSKLIWLRNYMLDLSDSMGHEDLNVAETALFNCATDIIDRLVRVREDVTS